MRGLTDFDDADHAWLLPVNADDRVRLLQTGLADEEATMAEARAHALR